MKLLCWIFKSDSCNTSCTCVFNPLMWTDRVRRTRFSVWNRNRPTGLPSFHKI